MTSPLCFWCFCVWAAANWPPGSALQLQPGMPNVCREEQLTLVRLSRPCTQAFVDTIQFWKQGCPGPRWCIGYERRIRYYIIYRHVYAIEHQTVFQCCPGWNRWDDEPGCFSSVSSLGTHFSGSECSDGDTQQCLCIQGFHGPHCQYDINECAVDNGGCQDRCCNTIGSYYCVCQAGQKLEEDGRGCEDVNECAMVNGGCQQRCINTLGTFHCECDTGYRRHADGRTCIKTDPCAGENGCAHQCQSENGVARCACHAGYQLSEDKKACEDINECAEELTPCAHRCINSKGSFTCTCHPGFELGADGKHCYRIELEIVNICEENNGGCSHHCEPAIGGAHCSCNDGHQLDTDGKTCIALDDDQLEEEKEEIDIVRFPGLLVQSLPQPFPYYGTSLTASYEEENDDADQEAEGEVQELTALHKVVCLDGTFGWDCSLSCEDCMNGGRCQEGKGGCFCSEGWTGLICNESSILRTGEYQQAPMGCLKGFFGKNCKRKCHCANNAHCHRVYGACMCDLGRYGRFCHLSCPRGAYGASCSLECQCVEENTLECSAKNGSCTCKSGYQGNRCQEEFPLPA
uniref:EGF-like and EMI domain-containing protein 1 isoform X1 n=1 Tax=Arvicanthis niloticus TaxID=61156 RepID=UPI0014873023|nr:EGF-like and EMI domain-containing protein 1 isoform X1 [Arvicanthis niloticus]